LVSRNGVHRMMTDPHNNSVGYKCRRILTSLARIHVLIDRLPLSSSQVVKPSLTASHLTCCLTFRRLCNHAPCVGLETPKCISSPASHCKIHGRGEGTSRVVLHMKTTSHCSYDEFIAYLVRRHYTQMELGKWTSKGEGGIEGSHMGDKEQI
jgi:hypothetical protein